jgi:hypothetical protein
MAHSGTDALGAAAPGGLAVAVAGAAGELPVANDGGVEETAAFLMTPEVV